MLARADIALKGRLDDKLMRFFRRVCDNFRRKHTADPIDPSEQQNFLVFLKIRNNFMTYFSRLFRENPDSPTMLVQFFDSTKGTLSLDHFSFAPEGDYGREVNR